MHTGQHTESFLLCKISPLMSCSDAHSRVIPGRRQLRVKSIARSIFAAFNSLFDGKVKVGEDGRLTKAPWHKELEI